MEPYLREGNNLLCIGYGNIGIAKQLRNHLEHTIIPVLITIKVFENMDECVWFLNGYYSEGTNA